MGAFFQLENDDFSFEINSTYSLRGERLDGGTLRIETSFIDAHVLGRIKFLEVFSLGSGIGYYHALGGRLVNKTNVDDFFSEDIDNYEELSQVVVPFEIGFEFQNEATLHFSFGYSLTGGYNSPGLTFRFPIGKSSVRRRFHYRSNAKNHIKEFQDGVLLVRLSTSKPLIDRLSSSGKEAEMIKSKETIAARNKSIIQAFNSKFDFVPVYFFESTYSSQVKKGDYSMVTDASSEPIRPEVIGGKKVFIAEFTNLSPDTVKYYSGTILTPHPEGGIKRTNLYGNSSSGATFYALVVKDSSFVQLARPFPYFVRCYERSIRQAPEQSLFVFPIYPFITWNFDEAVDRFNRRLKRFAKRNQ